MSEINIFNKSLKDYLTKEMLTLLIYPLIGSMIVLYISFFGLANMGLESLENAQLQIEQQQTMVENGVITEEQMTQTYTGSSILDFMLKYTVTSWIVSFLVYTVGILFIGYLSIFISLIIIGFLTPKILGIIHKRHYSNLDINTNFSILDGIGKIIKTAFVMILLLIAMIPFYFIPFINIIAINLPFYYFFHKMLHFDVGSTLTSKQEYGQIYYPDRLMMRLRTLALYSVSLLPFVAFFISIFYIVYLGHVYFTKLQEIKTTS
jgi:hypothetical protein